MQKKEQGLNKKEVEFLKDIRAFIEWAIINKNSVSFWTVLATLAHDARGLFDYKTDKFFLPRTSGYLKRQLDEMAKEMDK